MRLAPIFLLALLMIVPVRAQTIPSEWRAPALAVVGWFETSGGKWGTVTGDFDCQGVSAGIGQWNIGKASLKPILNRFSQSSVDHFMPTYGRELIKQVNISTDAGLVYVRRFQAYQDAKSCNALQRRATWTNQGTVLRSELSALMSSDEGQSLQISVTDKDAENAWALAREWARAKRGQNAAPTFREFVFFYDTYNFNGSWWKDSANYKTVSDLKKTKGAQGAFKQATRYLATERSSKYYQEWEAAENAKLWEARQPTEDELDLFLHAYLVAKHIGAANAIPFRLNVMSRRGVIIFNDGYVNCPKIKSQCSRTTFTQLKSP